MDANGFLERDENALSSVACELSFLGPRVSGKEVADVR